MDEPSDIEAAIDFQVQFMDRYGNDHINFSSSSLNAAIADTCHVSIESRKILGLYFHNRNDPFSEMFCDSIRNWEIKEILERSFYFLGWNVAEKLFHNSLTKALNENLGFTHLESMVTKGHAAFIIIFAIEKEACIFSLLHGHHIKKRDVLNALKEVENSFMNENNNEKQLQEIIRDNNATNQFGSLQFQQMMCQQLGDRDYDRFECNQHDCLKQNIGFAKFGPPIAESGYDKEQEALIDATYNQICTHSNEYSENQNQIVISFIYNCLEPLPKAKLARAKKYPDYNPQTDLLPIPIFVIRKCLQSSHPCRIIIDNDNRVYDSWENYIQHNKHYECIMIVPKDGRYIQDENGHVILERHLSPSCGIGTTLLNVTDIGTTVAGIASGAVFGAALIPAITVAPVLLVAAGITGAGVGIYSITRSIYSLYDRNKHKQCMSFANSEVRGAYLNILAGSLGFVGAGATTAMSQLAARGINISKGAQFAVNTINVCNITASGVSVGNSSYQVISDWIVEQKTPSALTVIQLTSSILFFANAAYNFKSAATITEEAQISTLTKYQESLRSNRHRKTFSKMLKETIRQNSGDRNVAHAEVISACRKIPDKNTVFAVLTRNNKMFNKGGIRIFAEDGQIKLNGVSVDLIEFGDMSKSQKSQLLSNVPVLRKPVQNLNNVATFDFSSITIDRLILIGKYGKLIINGCTLNTLLNDLIKDFSSEIQIKISIILRNVVDMLLDKLPELDEILHKYVSVREPLVIILKLILKYIKNFASDLENASNNDQLNNGQGVQQNSLRQYLNWIEKAIDMFLLAGDINAQLLQALFNYVFNSIVEKIYEHFLAEDAVTYENTGTLTRCVVCNGHYFSSVQ